MFRIKELKTFASKLYVTKYFLFSLKYLIIHPDYVIDLQQMQADIGSNGESPELQTFWWKKYAMMK